jgi:hypothetical protein
MRNITKHAIGISSKKRKMITQQTPQEIGIGGDNNQVDVSKSVQNRTGGAKKTEERKLLGRLNAN